MCLKALKREIREIRRENLEPFLNSNLPAMREAARETLENPRPYDIFLALIKLILRPLYKRMMLLRDSMIEAQREAHYPVLVESLTSPDTTERKAAVRGLTDYPGKETVKLIADQLLNGPRSLRIDCVEALWKIGMKEAVQPLKLSLVSETDCFTRVMISLALFALGDTSAFETIFDDIAENSIQNDHWDMTDLLYSGLVEELGADSIPFLEDGLRHADWHVRWISIRLIYSLKESKKVLKKYQFLRQDPHPEVQGIFTEMCD
jgi:HEAT repeat protein